MQKSLGVEFEVIEEGANSRTTDLDDPKRTGKNGADYLVPCLGSHFPLDVVILMLGTNDLKEQFNRNPDRIAEGIQNLLNLIKKTSKDEETKLPKIILICPPIVNETVKGVEEEYLGAEVKSKALPSLYREVTEKNGCIFLNLQEHIQPSKLDGYHFDAESHKVVADIIKDRIKLI